MSPKDIRDATQRFEEYKVALAEKKAQEKILEEQQKI
jgi:hypothetical protein